MTALSSISTASHRDAKPALEGTQPLRKRYAFQIIGPRDTGSAIYRRSYRSHGFLPQEPDAVDVHIIPIVNYPEPDTTVYDVVPRGRARNRLLDTIRHRMLLQADVDLDAVPYDLYSTGFLGRLMHPAIDVVVRFSDGGQIGLELGNTAALTFDLVDASARDSHGNLVPVVREQMATTGWTFNFHGPGNPLDAGNMRDQLRFLGVDLEHLAPNAERYACDAAPDASSVVCAAF